MNKFFTIAKAWGIAMFHTDEQKKLAEERMTICNECPSVQEVNVSDISGGLVNNYYQCGACGCPLMAKIYTPESAPDGQKCPQNKWKK